MELEVVTDGLLFPEGPIAMADGSVLLVEIRRQTLTRVLPSGRQEIVARAQYRGEVKRRLVRVHVPAGTELKPGQEYNGGVVVDSAAGEALAVMPV